MIYLVSYVKVNCVHLLLRYRLKHFSSEAMIYYPDTMVTLSPERAKKKTLSEYGSHIVL